MKKKVIATILGVFALGALVGVYLKGRSDGFDVGLDAAPPFPSSSLPTKEPFFDLKLTKVLSPSSVARPELYFTAGRRDPKLLSAAISFMFEPMEKPLSQSHLTYYLPPSARDRIDYSGKTAMTFDVVTPAEPGKYRLTVIVASAAGEKYLMCARIPGGPWWNGQMYRRIFVTVTDASGASMIEKSHAELQKRWDEAREVSGSVFDLIRDVEAKERETVLAELGRMRRVYAGHPALPWVLIALAQLREAKDPDKAMALLKEASEHPIKTDEWGFGQQAALKRLAALYEKRGKYRSSVMILSRWVVRAPCGTGIATSQSWKMFKMLELRLRYDDPDAVFADLWRQVEAGETGYGEGNSEKHLAGRIRELYGERHRDRLARDVDAVSARHGFKKPPGRTAPLERRWLHGIRKELKAQIESAPPAP